ncbi:D-alanyl-D-alanine carboxypeptidase [Candidatus Kaiserbacteria bacterium]|nr:D-alanyl-D-alanine carboxypeptidase [Candidatus Kaiserbacteria bacterium]
MNTSELQKLAEHARSMRESGAALLLASGILAVFFFLSLVKDAPPPAPIEITIPPTVNAFTDVDLEAKAAVVYDFATGETLYAKNADAQLPLASLTKLLTVYAALSKLSPDTPITVPASAVSVEGARTFNVGQIFSLADLARLTLTASLNDGAVAIASATAERENRSQNEMLAGAAAALNLSQTYAVNGSGLDENFAVAGGYGSAYDVARLVGALVNKAPSIAAATTFDSAEAISAGGTSISVKNTDPIAGSIPHLLLSKTGYTDLAGGNLALVFDAGIGHPIAVVVLGSSLKERFTDGIALVASTLAHFAGVASL